jgi:thiamine biosynthesis lipoprotein
MNVVTLAREAMRTRFEAVLCNERLTPADLRAAGEEALAEVARVEGWLSVYRSDADLFHVNARAADTPVRVDARVLRLLQRARELTVATGGAFDMTVGPLLRVWGLEGEGHMPDAAEIEGARRLVGMDRHVRLDEEAQTVAFDTPGVHLDPGAIGKGYALDRAANVLREAGIRRALVHGGTSTVVALGAAPDREDGWPVAVQHPLHPTVRLATVLLRDDESLSVSAVHGKTFWAEGRRFGHVVNPRTGRPVEDTVLAAAIGPSATDTDALSTALLVLGTVGLPRLTERFPEMAGFLVADVEPEQRGLRAATTGSGLWRDLNPA